MIFQQQLSRFVAMSSTAAKRSVAKEVARKAKEGKCLICESRAGGSRGLCVSHYLKFYRELQSRPLDRRADFELEQIREGRVLASGSVRRLHNPTPFTSEIEDTQP